MGFKNIDNELLKRIEAFYYTQELKKVSSEASGTQSQESIEQKAKKRTEDIMKNPNAIMQMVADSLNEKGKAYWNDNMLMQYFGFVDKVADAIYKAEYPKVVESVSEDADAKEIEDGTKARVKSLMQKPTQSTGHVIGYIVKKGPEFWDNNVIEYAIKNKDSVASLVSDLNPEKFENLDWFFNQNAIKNIYGPKTDVTKVSKYNNSKIITKALDEIQSIQLNVPNELSDREATMICIGEWLDKKFVEPVGKYLNEGSDDSNIKHGKEGRMVSYEAYLAGHFFHPSREKEWANLIIGKDARERTQKTFDKFAVGDIADAAKNLERVLNVSVPYALNLSNEENTLPFCVLATEAYKLLKEPRFKKHVNLPEDMESKVVTIKAILNSRKAFESSLDRYNNERFKALTQGKTGSILNDPAMKKIYEDYALDVYIKKYMNDSANNFSRLGYNVNCEDCGRSKFDLFYGTDPERAREELRNILRKDPKFIDLIESATYEKDIAKDKYLGVDNIPKNARLLTGDSKTTKASISSITDLYNEKLTAVLSAGGKGSKSFKQAATSVKQNLDGIFKRGTLNKDELSALNLSVKQLNNETIVLRDSLMEKNKSIDNVNAFLGTIGNLSECFESDIKNHETFGVAAEEYERKLNNPMEKAKRSLEESIKYNQYKLSLALDSLENINKNADKYKKDKYEEKCKDVYKVMKKSVAAILAGNSLWGMVMSSKGMLDADDYMRFSDETLMKNVGKDLYKSDAFKNLVKKGFTDRVKSLAYNKQKNEYPVESINNLAKDLVHEMAVANTRPKIKTENEKQKVL